MNCQALRRTLSLINQYVENGLLKLMKSDAITGEVTITFGWGPLPKCQTVTYILLIVNLLCVCPETTFLFLFRRISHKLAIYCRHKIVIPYHQPNYLDIAVWYFYICHYARTHAPTHVRTLARTGLVIINGNLQRTQCVSEYCESDSIPCMLEIVFNQRLVLEQ